jgi:hypothetical protein
VWPEGLGKLKKNSLHFMGSRTRNLPACSIVPQPLRYRALERHVVHITVHIICIALVNWSVYGKSRYVHHNVQVA